MLAAQTHSQNAKSAAPAERAKRSAQPSAQAAFNPAWARLAMGIQPKLTISQPGDAYEEEADAVADRVMRMADPALVGSAPSAIQRKCACGGEAKCSCEDDEKTHIQTKRESSATAAAPVNAAVAVHAAQDGGAPLPSAVRAYFEPRFGYDFSNVRVHADAHSATAARAVQARAYTLGRDVVFGAGEFAPATAEGKRLLAHELTHVVQQGGGGGTLAPSAPAIQRQPPSVAQVSALDATAKSLITASQNAKRDPGVRAVALVWGILHNYFQAESAALWVNVVSYDEAVTGLGNTQAGTGAASQGKVVVGKQFRDGTSDATFEARVADVGRVLKQIELWRRGKAVPDTCQPKRALTWADFKGNVGSYAAFTAFDHTVETVGSEKIIRATFDPARSYVRAAVKGASNPALNGCAALIEECKTFLTKNKKSTFSLSSPGTCPASRQINPAVKAATKTECKTAIGVECNTVREADADRLLRHEQLHFDIGCVLAEKGTRALSLKPTESARILKAVKDKAHDLSNDSGAYDTETDHGCKAGPQAAWETAVARGMPLVVIS